MADRLNTCTNKIYDTHTEKMHGNAAVGIKLTPTLKSKMYNMYSIQCKWKIWLLSHLFCIKFHVIKTFTQFSWAIVNNNNNNQKWMQSW